MTADNSSARPKAPKTPALRSAALLAQASMVIGGVVLPGLAAAPVASADAVSDFAWQNSEENNDQCYCLAAPLEGNRVGSVLEVNMGTQGVFKPYETPEVQGLQTRLMCEVWKVPGVDSDPYAPLPNPAEDYLFFNLEGSQHFGYPVPREGIGYQTIVQGGLPDVTLPGATPRPFGGFPVGDSVPWPAEGTRTGQNTPNPSHYVVPTTLTFKTGDAQWTYAFGDLPEGVDVAVMYTLSKARTPATVRYPFPAQGAYPEPWGDPKLGGGSTAHVLNKIIVRRPSRLVNDEATTPVSTPVSLDLKFNDKLVPLSRPGAFEVATQPTHGAVTVNPDGSSVYTPEPGYVGTDTFTYTVTDAATGTQHTATATIRIGQRATPSPTAPATPAPTTPTPTTPTPTTPAPSTATAAPTAAATPTPTASTPAAPKPAASEPAASEPAASEPAASEPASSEPAVDEALAYTGASKLVPIAIGAGALAVVAGVTLMIIRRRKNDDTI